MQDLLEQKGIEVKISYNSKVVLTFSLIAVIVWFLDYFFSGFTLKYFAVRSTMDCKSILDWVRLVSHVLGHANWDHVAGNLTFMLLLGPSLEEKYGGPKIFVMIFATALVIGIVNIMFFSNILLGASGIVFLFIVLSSFVGENDGTIPVALILVVIIFLGKEIAASFTQDNVSQLAHILGGVMGIFFGFVFNGSNELQGDLTD